MENKLPIKVLALLLALVGSFEGLRRYAYRDPVGVPTICFGHIAGVKMGDIKSREECDGLLVKELKKSNAYVRRCITAPINDNQLAALISATYNLGPSVVCGSTLQRRFNAHDYVGGCNELTMAKNKWGAPNGWTYANGVRYPGLITRREVERTLCLKAAA